MSEYLKKLVEDRQSAYHAAKSKMDEAAAEGRSLSAEEREFVDRTFAELDEKRATIDTLVEAEKREREIAESMRGLEDVARPVEARTAGVESDSDILRAILTGERLTVWDGPGRLAPVRRRSAARRPAPPWPCRSAWAASCGRRIRTWSAIWSGRRDA